MPNPINLAAQSQLLAEMKAILNLQPPNCPNCYQAKVIDWFFLNSSGYFVYQAPCCQRKYLKKQGFRPQAI